MIDCVIAKTLDLQQQVFNDTDAAGTNVSSAALNIYCLRKTHTTLIAREDGVCGLRGWSAVLIIWAVPKYL